MAAHQEATDSSNYTDFNRLRVNELKLYLQQRGISGFDLRKSALVELCVKESGNKVGKRKNATYLQQSRKEKADSSST